MNEFIPIYKPKITKLEKKNVLKCIDSGWISSRGEFIEKFERKIEEFLDVKNAITCSNGSVSLTLILHALGIGFGDEILVPSLTYAATVSAPNLLGVKCILFDSDDAFQPNIFGLKNKITKNTKALLLPQLYGNSADMDEILKFVNDNNLFLIEDSAEVFGSKFKNKSLGTFGIAGSFSFFGNKTITTGEGGCVVTNDDNLAIKIRSLKNQSHTSNFNHDGPGFNFRMTNIQAAIGCAQFDNIETIINKKIKIANFYRKNLSNKILKIKENKYVYSTEWMPLFVLPEGYSYNDFYIHMKNKNIDIRPCFKPIHLMNNFNISYDKEELKNCEKIYLNAFNLPCFPDLKNNDLNRIVIAVNDFLK